VEEVEGLHVRRFKGRYFSAGEAAQAGLGKAAFSLSMLRALVCDRSIDVLHVHTHNRLASALVLVARLRRLPVVVTLHSEFRRLRPRWLYWFPNEVAIRYAHAVISVNRAIAEDLYRFGIRLKGVVTIPNGVNAERFTTGNARRFKDSLGLDDTPIALTPGRICDVKNQRLIVDVAPRLKEQGIDVRWVILGVVSEQAYAESLAKAIADRGLSERILVKPGLPPESAELADAYAAADVVVVPSKHEAFGLVVLEAWCAGKPVVATRVGGLPEVIEDNENGRLVEPGDAAELARAIAGLLRDDGERERLGKAGQAKAQAFDWTSVGTRITGVYDVITRPRSPR
jgi:glycosyltransferase involved in cell wall biosynthesis